MGPRAGLDFLEKRKLFFFCRGRIADNPSHSLVALLLRYSGPEPVRYLLHGSNGFGFQDGSEASAPSVLWMRWPFSVIAS